MTRDDLELVPEMVKSGKISWKQAVDDLVVFINCNKPLFGLTRYDEDLISEMNILFLDRGISSLQSYDETKGTFYTYLFCFVVNICNSIRKTRLSSYILEKHSIIESISSYSTRMEEYANIRYDDFERPKIPYKYIPVNYKDFQLACKTDTYHIKKVINQKQNKFAQYIKFQLRDYSPNMIQNIIMVLALKSSYYITDSQIRTIAEVFNIDYLQFYQIIQEIKIKLEPRLHNRKILEERRNRAYYLKNKIRDQIEWNEGIVVEPYSKLVLDRRFQRNSNNWKNLNYQLKKGKILLRPTTKLIAQVLGMSTRQVTYYQSTARKLGIDISKV